MQQKKINNYPILVITQKTRRISKFVTIQIHSGSFQNVNAIQYQAPVASGGIRVRMQTQLPPEIFESLQKQKLLGLIIL